MRISFHSIDRLASTERQDPVSLEPNAVHLWGIELNGSPDCLTRCAQWLDDVERGRAARLVREEDWQHYVLAHGGLRAVLSWYLGVSPDVVALERSAAGKPFVTSKLGDRSAITFNMSHAHGRALIAVSNAQEVGVDLEFVRLGVEAEKLSQRYFADPEHTAIMRLPQEQRAARFFRYWVAKEAALKAQGIGLQGLAECKIVFGSEAADAEVGVRSAFPVQHEVRVRFLSCGNGWEAAVAAQELDRIKQWT
ncbi:MAG: 4'-phosphopantetheinyl transferase superfamily protein [Nitrospira sp. BO4]|nr:4'-phosphopantetheinyl transferase superfamily protein [Nitrospira sp. BO4]